MKKKIIITIIALILLSGCSIKEKDEKKGFDPRKVLKPGYEAIKAKVKEKMEIFGSIDKAN